MFSSLHVSGLLKLTTVNSTTYGLISLIVGGAALAIAFGYLLTVSPSLESQFQSQYRAFTEGKLHPSFLVEDEQSNKCMDNASY